MSVPTPILQYTLSDATMKGLLPSGYTPLAYVESTGTLWINTGYNINSADRIGGKFTSEDTSGSILAPFGARNNETSNCFNLLVITGSSYNPLYGVEIYTAHPISRFDKLFEVDFNKNKCTINGVTSTLATNVSYTGSKAMYLFALNNGGSVDSRKWKGKCYYFAICNGNGVLQVDLRPARRDSDGVIGMYDLVSRTFKTNSGSDTFIAGPPLAVGKGGGKSLPEEYLLVEYLESQDGVNCYINTGFIPDNNTRLVTSVYPTSTNTSAHFWFGSRTGSSTNQAFGVYLAGSNSAGIDALWNTSGNVGTSLSGQKQYDIDFDKNVLKINGSTAYTFTSGTFTGTYPIFIFAINTSGSMDLQKGGQRVGYVKIYDNGTIVRMMFPCYRKSDMKPGMYDTVNGVFYTNAGSGEFILGPTINVGYTCEVNASSINNPPTCPQDPMIYTEPDGSRWIRIIHHAPNGTSNLFDSDSSLTNGCFKNYDAWFYADLCNYITDGKWELMVKEKTTSGASEAKYRWIQTKNPMTCVWSDVTSDKITKITSSGYSSMTTNGLFRHSGSGTYLSYDNGTSGSNWYGIGAYSSYNGGFPSLNNGIVTTGYSDLYLRVNKIDGLYTNVSGIYDSNKGWVGYFKASNQTGFLSIPAQPLLTNCTVAFWAKLDTNKSWLCLGSVDNSYYLGASSSGTGGFYHAKVGSSVSCYVDGVAKSAPYGDTNWHFYCFTGVNLSSWPIIYLNNYTGWNINGCYQNLMIFDTALTAAQVKELYGK